MKHKYLHYTAEDFILDEAFQQWVQQPSGEQQAFWEQFLHRHPEKRAAVEEARHFLRSLAFRKVTPTAQEYHTVLQNIEAGHPKAVISANHFRKASFWQWQAAAALFLVGLGTLIYLWWVVPAQTVTWQTAYGEKKEIMLPDSSVVVLNANSTLRYAAAWDDRQPREVWLAGEAFFEVKKKPVTSQQFLVHASTLEVEVLGTSFNVNHRRDKTQVVLNTGKIRLHRTDTDRDPQNDALVMQPGQMVEYFEQEKKLVQKTVNPAAYSSWQENVLIFEGTCISAIAQRLEDTYGFRVVIQDPSLADTKFTATIPTDRVETLLSLLSELLGVPVTQTGRTVTIGK